MPRLRPGSPIRTPASPTKLRRLLTGATQDDVATTSGVSQVHLSTIERGARRLTPRTAALLAPLYAVAATTLVREQRHWRRTHGAVPEACEPEPGRARRSA